MGTWNLKHLPDMRRRICRSCVLKDGYRRSRVVTTTPVAGKRGEEDEHSDGNVAIGRFKLKL